MDVPSDARFCPHCGVESPIAAIAQTQQIVRVESKSVPYALNSGILGAYAAPLVCLALFFTDELLWKLSSASVSEIVFTLFFPGFNWIFAMMVAFEFHSESGAKLWGAASFVVFAIPTFVAFPIIGMFVGRYQDRKCPQCNSYQSKTIDSETSSSSYETTDTATHRTTHYDKFGNEKGYSEFEYEEPVTRFSSTTFLVNECRACQMRWVVVR